MAERLDYEDLAEAGGCRHEGGPTWLDVMVSLDTFFTPARLQAIRTQLETDVPAVTWTPARVARAVRSWIEAH